ncbi:hypothetical protein J4419_05880 [Candidatus Woesearchaeota archaeon]|nr:hypothetical protein [Candidatus Woesearchaeota archaeon]
MESLISLGDVLETYRSKEAGLKALSPYAHWFPLFSSPKLAGVIADLMGDGHLQSEPKWKIDYCSKQVSELNRFENEIFTLFGVKGTMRRCSTNRYESYLLSVCNRPLARVLASLGVPSGQKVLKSFSLPLWIEENPKCFSRFMNRLLSCEGSVDVCGKAIELKMAKSIDLIPQGISFFEQLREGMISHFGITPTRPFLERARCVRKDGVFTQGIRMKIKRASDLPLVQEMVGIEDPEKSRKLALLCP